MTLRFDMTLTMHIHLTSLMLHDAIRSGPRHTFGGCNKDQSKIHLYVPGIYGPSYCTAVRLSIHEYYVNDFNKQTANIRGSLYSVYSLQQVQFLAKCAKQKTTQQTENIGVWKFINQFDTNSSNLVDNDLCNNLGTTIHHPIYPQFKCWKFDKECTQHTS